MNDRDLLTVRETRADAVGDLVVEAVESSGCLERAAPPGRWLVPDWPAAERVLDRHGLSAMAMAALPQALVSPPCPPEVLERLKRARHHGVIRHQVALRALGRIHPLFERAGVPYAVLKGPHLQEFYYPAAFPRLYGDVDLLVRRRDLGRAIALLRAADYSLAGSAVARFVLRRIHFHLLLLPRSRGLPRIELHWSLVDRANLYRVCDDEVLARTVLQESGAVRFGVLAREDVLLYLCLHMAKHGVLNGIGLRSGQPAAWFCREAAGNRMIWCLDLALWLQREMGRLDWHAVRQRAAAWNVAGALAESLSVVGLLLPSSQAGAALAHLGAVGERTAPARERGLDRLLRTALGRRCLVPFMGMHSRLLFRPVRLLFLGRLFLPSPRQLRDYYGSRSLPLALLYIKHPFHMLRRLIGLT